MEDVLPVASSAPSVARPSRGSSPSPAPPGFFFLIFGVVLPVITLTIECVTHQCAGTFFDPIPTWWHVLLVALVPAGNLGVWLAARRGGSPRPRALGHFNALTIGVSLGYAILFGPLLPLSIFALMLLGWGLLPLTPLLAFVATLAGRRALLRLPNHPLPSVWMGIAAALCLLAVPVARQHLTNHGLELALREGKEDQRRGVWLLRYAGDRDHLLAACYGKANIWPLSAFGEQTAFWGRTEEIQRVFYQVTGEAYNSLPAPAFVSMGRGRGRGSWNFDAGVGGTQVADKVAGLTMTTSLMEGRVDTAASTSYFEWTMVFKNIAANASEARTQIELPPGAAVSRLTLWINGEPREAAFGGRNQVRAAYQEIAVVQRRDPVLVTTSGPDRVLMQCFPVPPEGGEMKVRVGITAPLRMLDEREGLLALPRLAETNFAQPEEFRHEVVMSGDQPMSDPQGKVWRDRHALKLTDESLRGRTTFHTRRASAGDVWADDPLDPAMIIRQTMRRMTVPAPRRIAFVVDGSKIVGGAMKEIARTLETLPPSQDFTIYFAGDDVEVLPEKTDPRGAARWLRERKTIGGRDNLPALLRAWDDAAAVPDSALVWIHAPQPLLLTTLDPLLTRFTQTGVKPAFHDLAVTPGPNRLLEKAANAHNVKAVNFGGAPMEDLRHLLGLWSGVASEFVVEWARVPRSEPLAAEAKGDRHVARLWGLHEIERLRTAEEPGSLDQAIKLALALQLVTPVSGAVVLETQQQYDRHGLKPVPPESTPTIPEPSTALLLAGGAMVWLANLRPRRRFVVA